VYEVTRDIKHTGKWKQLVPSLFCKKEHNNEHFEQDMGKDDFGASNDVAILGNSD
jgi:hypothetical protein